MPWSASHFDGTRAKILARLRSSGASGLTAPDIVPIVARGRVKDGFQARRNAGAASVLRRLCAEGQAIQVTGTGRHAVYCITGAGLDWLEEREARARGAAARGPRPELGAGAELETSSEPPAELAGLFD